MASTQAVIKLQCQFRQPLSQSIKLTLKAQQIAVLLAPSGGGKSSVFNGLVGLCETAGQVYLAGDQNNQLLLKPHQRSIAYVPQQVTLFSHLSVAKLIKLVAAQQSQPYDIAWALEPMGLLDKLSLMPNQLSGGQKQRLAMLMALQKGAPLLLLDEVFSGLDEMSKRACFKVLRRYLQDCNAAAMIACHQLHDALALADIALLQARQGNELCWKTYDIGTGLNLYQHNQLRLPDTNATGAGYGQLVSMRRAQVVAHHRDSGLTEYRIVDCRLFGRYRPTLALGQSIRLVMQADRFGIAIEPLMQSSFVNQIKVLLFAFEQVEQDGQSGVLVQCCLAQDRDNTDRLGSTIDLWITRKSFERLQLKMGQCCYLIGKADGVEVIECY